MDYTSVTFEKRPAFSRFRPGVVPCDGRTEDWRRVGRANWVSCWPTMGKFTTPIEALELRRLLSAILRVDANSIAPNPDGATWDTAYPSLQQALAAANF